MNNVFICNRKRQIHLVKYFRTGKMKYHFGAFILIASILATAVPVGAIIRVTKYVDIYGAVGEPNNIYYFCGPSSSGCSNSGPFPSVDAMFPYLSSTNPSGKMVCVGYATTSLQVTCNVVQGSGTGAGTGSGTYWSAWTNVDSVTIDIHGSVTAYYS